MSFTVGSLFDGSGGFPLSAVLCGGIPVWASEIEPYPIAVTKTRFPHMKHLGSVTDIKGDEIEPVDVITFGSPCQDLSVAGKRAGLKHETNGDEETTRSGLFMDAVRIIKEMREATNGKYPRFALWENVPGAFSSNKGEDFRIVLEELIKISEPTAVMPGVPQKGWAYADSYCGNGWSLAYRVFDAQYWGVPQRRRRIYLVADFTGGSARKVLFEREGLRGYFTESRKTRETVTSDVENCSGTTDCKTDGIINLNKGDVQSKTILNPQGIAPPLYAGECRGGGGECYVLDRIPYTLKIRSGCEGGGKGALIQEDKSATLSTMNDQYLFQPITDSHILDDQGGSVMNVRTDGKSPTLREQIHGHPPVVLQPKIYRADNGKSEDVAPTLVGDHNNRVTDFTALVVEPTECMDVGWLNTIENCSPTLLARTYKDPHLVCYRQGGFGDYVENEAGTYRASGGDLGGGSENIVVEGEIQYVVRRLTPIECARLQGFADWWGHPDHKDDFTDEEYTFWLNVRNTHAEINGKQIKDYTKSQMLTWYNKLHTDSSEYKLWGNGIALPTALYCMQGIAEVLTK